MSKWFLAVIQNGKTASVLIFLNKISFAVHSCFAKSQSYIPVGKYMKNVFCNLSRIKSMQYRSVVLPSSTETDFRFLARGVD